MDVAHSPSGIEKKLLVRPFQVKTTDDAGAFEGYGAIFNDLHPTSSLALAYSGEWKDRVMPGAFKKTLEQHKRAGTLPVMLYMHERGNVVGAWRSWGETGTGLHVDGQVALSAKTPAGAGIHELMKMGGLGGLSMGFRPVQVQLNQDKKIRDILEVEVAEISIVDVPGIHRARVTDVKSDDPRFIEYLEGVLRDAGLSRREAKALLADGFSALRDVAAQHGTDLRDAGSGGEAANPDVVNAVRQLGTTFRP
jgi:hypothetical protein